MKIRPIFAWYDLWIGAFWDRSHRRLYLFPIPCCGLVVEFRAPAAPRINRNLEAVADLIREMDKGDPTTETGWASDELLDYWLAVRSAAGLASAPAPESKP